MIIFENTFDQNVAKSATKQAFKKAIWIYVVFTAVFLILGLMMLLVNPRLAIFYIVMGILILPIGYVLTNAIQSKTNKTMSVMSAETKEVFEFDLELPPYRKPQIGAIIVKSLRDRALFVLLRAIVIAAPAGLFIWVLTHTQLNSQPVILGMAEFLNPLAEPFGMDGIILLAFLLGWPANEIVIPLMLMMYLSTGSMVEMENYTALHQILTANGWTWQTAASVLVFSLFHWPCSTTCLTIHKETGSIKWTLLAILLPTVTGFTLCFLLQQLFKIIALIPAVF